MWYDVDLGTFDESLHDVVCTRCEMYCGKCPCEYCYWDVACVERKRHKDIHFVIEATRKLLNRA